MAPIDMPSDSLRNPQNTFKLTINDEFAKYQETKVKKVYQNPLDFWRENSNSMPILAKASMSIYCVPASSAEPERHCSAAGLTITDLRSNLTTKNSENLILLREYLKNNS